MKKQFLYIIFLLSLFNNVVGQANINVSENGCAINTVTTNPDQVLNAFDWRTPNFTIYLQSGQGSLGVETTIVNPYFDQSLNPTTFNLANATVKDFAPADGWELLYRSFGTADAGVKTPFFVLYNRYNGTVRVFANIVNSGEFPYTAAAVTLSYKKPSNDFTSRRQTAILNQLGTTTFSMNEMQKDAHHYSPTSYLNSGVNNNYYWVYSDFYALFDPCTCGLESDWYLEVGLINNIDIDMTVSGVIERTIVDSNPNNPDETTVGGFFGKVQEYLAFGSGVVDGVNGTLASANQGFTTGQALLTNANTFANNLGPIIGKKASANLARSLGRLLFEVPRINMMLNLAKTAISTIKKLSTDFNNLNEPQSVEAIGSTSVTEIKTELTVTGNLKVKAPYVKTALKVPGAILPAGQGAIVAYNPVYNNILGVFNLYEQPKFEVKEFLPSSTINIARCNVAGPPTSISNQVVKVFPKITQLSIKDMPKLVINPAANLKLKSVDYQIVFDNYEQSDLSTTPILRGPMIPGQFSYFTDLFGYGCNENYAEYQIYTAKENNRETYLSSIGYDIQMRSSNQYLSISDSASIATPYLPQSCFDSYSLFSYSKIGHPQLRVKAIFEPLVNDPNSTVKEVIIIHTFNGIVETVPNTLPYTVTGTPNLLVSNTAYVPIGIDLPIDESALLFGYPSDVTYFDETISNNIYAIGDITIGNNVTIGQGNFTVKATGNIYFDKSLNAIPANSSVNFIAGKEIVVRPEAIVSPEVVLSIDPSVIKPCENAVDIVPTGTEIAAFCNGTVYNQRSEATRSILVTDVHDGVEESTNELSTIDFTMYPNPATNDVSLLFDNSIEGISVVLHDVAGKLVPIELTLNGREYVFNVSNCKQGIYFVTVSSYGGSQTKQLIVQ
jgi:hypothetical protein